MLFSLFGKRQWSRKKALPKSVGVVVISHGHFGTDMVQVVQKIIPGAQPLFPVRFSSHDSLNFQKRKLHVAIRKADRGLGVLVLADLLGATPCNVCQTFLKRGKVAMVTGYNLPMLIKLASLDDAYDRPEDLANFIQRYGQKNITVEEKAAKKG